MRGVHSKRALQAGASVALCGYVRPGPFTLRRAMSSQGLAFFSRRSCHFEATLSCLCIAEGGRIFVFLLVLLTTAHYLRERPSGFRKPNCGRHDFGSVLALKKRVRENADMLSRGAGRGGKVTRVQQPACDYVLCFEKR